jgi:electron transfer flavoprotein alpha subunit
MVLIYSDNKKLVLELLSIGYDIAKDRNEDNIVLIIGETDDKLANEYIAHGANNVYVVESDIDLFKAEEYAEILEKVIKETESEIILFGSNKNGKELASRLAGRLNAGCSVDCTNIYTKDKKIMTERVVYSGNAISVEQFNSKPVIITVPSKVFNPLSKSNERKGKIIKTKIETEKSNSKVIRVQDAVTENVNVEDADIIVSCGRGFKKKDDIKLANDLADVLKGKTIGCSRPIAADLKWMSEDHWIGLSGHKVKPKLYIATGISGQIQHIAGMRDSGIIVAINKDPDALIFKSADYGIVGDLYEVIPKLAAAIKDKMK